jgi:hypothetical protein
MYWSILSGAYSHGNIHGETQFTRSGSRSASLSLDCTPTAAFATSLPPHRVSNTQCAPARSASDPLHISTWVSGSAMHAVRLQPGLHGSLRIKTPALITAPQAHRLALAPPLCSPHTGLRPWRPSRPRYGMVVHDYCAALPAGRPAAHSGQGPPPPFRRLTRLAFATRTPVKPSRPRGAAAYPSRYSLPLPYPTRLRDSRSGQSESAARQEPRYRL